jgi:hypothetical protein
MANIFEKINGQFQRVIPPAPVVNAQSNFTNNFGRTLSTPIPTTTNTTMNPNDNPAAFGPNPIQTPYPRQIPPPTQPQVSQTQTQQQSYQQPTSQQPTITQPTQTQNPYDAFNLLLQESLKTAQKLDTTDLLKQQRELQRQSIERSRGQGVRPPTAEELKFLSPSQQESMRKADIGALSPDIDEVAYQITKTNQDRKNAIEAIMLARDAGDKAREFEAEQKWKQADLEYKQATLAETKRSNQVSESQKSIGGTELSSKQYTALNQITTRFQADPIINQAIKGGNAGLIADQIIANPKSATSQLKSLYVLVKNLDPDSAVREGELALANQTQSYMQQFGNTLARITEGRVISPDAAVSLAQATKELMSAWNSTANKREKQYTSQANTLGIGNDFNSYLQGSELGYKSGTSNIIIAPDGTQVELID